MILTGQCQTGGAALFLCKVQKNNAKIWQLIRQVGLAKVRKVCYTAINK